MTATITPAWTGFTGQDFEIHKLDSNERLKAMEAGSHQAQKELQIKEKEAKAKVQSKDKERER